MPVAPRKRACAAKAARRQVHTAHGYNFAFMTSAISASCRALTCMQHAARPVTARRGLHCAYRLGQDAEAVRAAAAGASGGGAGASACACGSSSVSWGLYPFLYKSDDRFLLVLGLPCTCSDVGRSRSSAPALRVSALSSACGCRGARAARAQACAAARGGRAVRVTPLVRACACGLCFAGGAWGAVCAAHQLTRSARSAA